MSFIVTEKWLNNRLENNLDDTVIVDVRFQMDKPEVGRKMYSKSHIPHAVYLDMDEDLSGEVQTHGGSHPLPDMDTLAAKIGDIGIDHNTTVVIYGKANDMFAARAWWLLHYMGHEKVYLLEGGFTGWVEAGKRVTDESPVREAKVFEPKILPNAVADMKQVRDKRHDKSSILLDSRVQDRYLGKTEPKYAKAGHIPGAKNFFWKDVLNEDGSWKNKETLQSQFSSLSKEDEIIVSCGSGLSACPNIVALKLAGYENVKLYPGSYSDWISYEENEIETKEE